MAAEVRPRRLVPVRVFCAECVFAEPAFVERGTANEHPVLECHRFPPMLVSAAGDLGDGSAITQVWPQMAEADFCGEGLPS